MISCGLIERKQSMTTCVCVPMRMCVSVRPVLERRCFSCHGPKEQKGKLRLDTLSTDLVQDARAAGTRQPISKDRTFGFGFIHLYIWV